MSDIIMVCVKMHTSVVAINVNVYNQQRTNHISGLYWSRINKHEIKYFLSEIIFPQKC